MSLLRSSARPLDHALAAGPSSTAAWAPCLRAFHLSAASRAGSSASTSTSSSSKAASKPTKDEPVEPPMPVWALTAQQKEGVKSKRQELERLRQAEQFESFSQTKSGKRFLTAMPLPDAMWFIPNVWKALLNPRRLFLPHLQAHRLKMDSASQVFGYPKGWLERPLAFVGFGTAEYKQKSNAAFEECKKAYAEFKRAELRGDRAAIRSCSTEPIRTRTLKGLEADLERPLALDEAKVDVVFRGTPVIDSLFNSPVDKSYCSFMTLRLKSSQTVEVPALSSPITESVDEHVLFERRGWAEPPRWLMRDILDPAQQTFELMHKQNEVEEFFKEEEMRQQSARNAAARSS